MMQQLGFAKSKKLLDDYKISFASFTIAKAADGAVKAAKKLGFPVVLKILSPDIVHKTEHRMIIAGLRSDKEVRAAFNDMMKRKGKACFEGMLVQKQVSGKEIIIGGKQDAQFGPVVLFGLGGIFVEVMKDVSVRVAPITKEGALEMVKEIRGYPLLAGVRGEKPVAINKIADAILAVSKIMLTHREIREMDLNPCIVDGKDCVAVDARIMVD